ncbi:hypothetical protein L581_2051 [Serratia fonticola AU-AP2C]|nr:hypothetical protein L581_2051 [Serratia fonticola AU-AP2C]
MVNSPALATFPPSSIDEPADQFQQRNQRFQNDENFID